LFTVQAQQTTYLNFLRSVMGPMVQLKIEVAGLHDPILFLLDISLANSIINYALGSVDLEPINRSLTDAERITLVTALEEYLPIFSQAFANTITDLKLTYINSPDVNVDQTINPASTLAGFIGEVSLADNPPAKVYIAYAGNALKYLLDRYKQMDRSKELDFSHLPAGLLSQIKAPLSAVLGETSLTTNEIRQFEVGDVVSLDTTINSPLAITIGNKLKLASQPGVKNKRSAARIIGLKEGAEIELPPPELAEKKEPAPEPKPAPPPPAPPKPAAAPAAKTAPPKPMPNKPLSNKLPEEFLDDEEEDDDDDILTDDMFSEEDILGEEEFDEGA
jgi:flagellar motor switch protein FliM